MHPVTFELEADRKVTLSQKKPLYLRCLYNTLILMAQNGTQEPHTKGRTILKLRANGEDKSKFVNVPTQRSSVAELGNCRRELRHILINSANTCELATKLAREINERFVLFREAVYKAVAKWQVMNELYGFDIHHRGE